MRTQEINRKNNCNCKQGITVFGLILFNFFALKIEHYYFGFAIYELDWHIFFSLFSKLFRPKSVKIKNEMINFPENPKFQELSGKQNQPGIRIKRPRKFFTRDIFPFV